MKGWFIRRDAVLYVVTIFDDEIDVAVLTVEFVQGVQAIPDFSVIEYISIPQWHETSQFFQRDAGGFQVATRIALALIVGAQALLVGRGGRI